MRIALLTAATTATALVGLAAPASAAAPTTTTLDTAFTTLGAADGETFFYVDGFFREGRGTGVVDVFGKTVECSMPEDGTPLPFVADGTRSASMVGTYEVECWDFAQERGGRATITVDLAWQATAEATRTRLASPRIGCTGYRDTAPAAVSGSVRLQAPALKIDAVAVPDPERPAELATTVSRCR